MNVGQIVSGAAVYSICDGERLREGEKSDYFLTQSPVHIFLFFLTSNHEN